MNRQALRRQPQISSCIVHSLGFLAMQVAVDFHGQPCRGAKEIEGVHTQWMLTAKDRTVGQASPQTRPEHDLGFGHCPAKALGPLES